MLPIMKCLVILVFLTRFAEDGAMTVAEDGGDRGEWNSSR